MNRPEVKDVSEHAHSEARYQQAHAHYGTCTRDVTQDCKVPRRKIWYPRDDQTFRYPDVRERTPG